MGRWLKDGEVTWADGSRINIGQIVSGGYVDVWGNGSETECSKRRRQLDICSVH